MIRHCSAGTTSLLLISVFISATNPFVLQLADPKTASDTLRQRTILEPRTLGSASRSIPPTPTRPSTLSNTRMQTHHSRTQHRERKLEFGGTEFDENLNEIDWLESKVTPSEASGKDGPEITPLSFPIPTPSQVEFNFSVSDGTKPVLVEIPSKSIGEKDEEAREDKIESVPLRPVHILRNLGNTDPLSPQVLVTLSANASASSSPGHRNETISWPGTQSPLQTFLHQLPTPSTPPAFTSTSTSHPAEAHASFPNTGGVRPKGPGNALRKPKFESPVAAAFLGVVVIGILTLAWLTKEDYSRPFYWALDEYQQPSSRTYRD